MLAAIGQIQEAARRDPKKRTAENNPFRLPAFPPQAIPPEGKRMAMDSNMTFASNAWLAGSLINSFAEEGLLFPGYTVLSEYAQRPEYRIITETIADDATRKWITFDITGTEEEEAERQAEDAEDPEGAETRREERVKKSGKSERVQELMDFLDMLEARDKMYEMVRGDGFFGRMHLHLSIGQTDNLDPAEMRTPIGDGRADISKAKVSPASPLRRLKTIEPVWTYPMAYNAQNPLLEDWYNPQYWYVMGQELHASRLLPYVTRPVPDILKPAYAFGGLSLSQIAEPYVNIWLRTRQSVADIVHSFSVMVLSTNMSALINPQAGGADLMTRMAAFNLLRDNNGAFVIDKDTETFTNVAAPVSGLEGLQAQSQEHMASVSRIPLVKLTGISPSGLNASSEGEIQVYYDTVAAYQNRSMRPILTRVVNFAMLSLWGEVDEDLKMGFAPLKEMTEKEKAELQKMQVERDGILIDKGVLAPQEVRVRIINDPEMPYGGLDPEDVPEPPAEEGLLGGEGGGKGGAGEGGDPFKDKGEFGKEPGAGDAQILPFYPAGADEAWNESDHPRAPDGKFGSGGGSAVTSRNKDRNTPLKQTDLKKVGSQMGSNPGGVYEDKSGTKFYVKAGKSTDHVANELLAADLFRMAGGNTLEYRPVEGGQHIATKLAKLDKKNAAELDAEERKAAQQDFVANAWLANWDAVGTGGDNVGVVGGKATTLDFGGSLAYRAMGSPKGAAFGDTVSELTTMRDPSMSPDAARFYKTMTDADMQKSAQRVTRITNDKIADAVKAFGGSPALAKKLMARKKDIAERFGLATDSQMVSMDEEDAHGHEHAPAGSSEGGQFVSKGGGGGGGSSSEVGGGGKEDDGDPKPGAYGGLWKANHGNPTPEGNFAYNAGYYVNQKPQIGIHYRRMMAKLLKDADKYKADDGLKEKLKGKLVDSLWGSLAAAKKKGKQDEVNKIAKAIEKLSGKKLNEQTTQIAKPESKSTPAHPAAKASKDDLEKAKKATNIFLPPGLQSPKGAELVKTFNEKYGSQTAPITDPAKLEQKVADFHKLKAEVEAAAEKHKAELTAASNAKQKAQAEAAAAQKAEQAKLIAEQMKDPDYAALAGVAKSNTDDYVKRGKHFQKVMKERGVDLTPVEGGLIASYIGSHYEAMNMQLYEGKVKKEQYAYRKALEKALGKMPVYEGKVIRGIQNITKQDFAKYATDHVVPNPAFMSAGKKEKLWGQFTLEIHGKSARDISMLNGEGGGEVVFMPHTAFEVTSNNGYHAVLKEMD
jgi:phage-related protein (TIGR01555 family)